MSTQIKMKEEDFVEEFNPWNRDAQLLERMLESHDSMQTEIIFKEGKDEREVVSVGGKAKFESIYKILTLSNLIPILCTQKPNITLIHHLGIKIP